MTDIPTTIPSFPVLEDDVDFVEAEDQNVPNDEITALATLLGMLGTGKTQADSIDFLELFRKARQSFRLSWIDNDTIQASIGEIVCVNSGASIRVARKNAATTNITFTDIDTGARAADTTYFIHAVADATANTVTFAISLSATAPTGITTFGLIGKIATDGSSNIIESSVVSFVGEVVVQTQRTTDGEVATGSTVIPSDDSIPDITEGDQFMTLPFLPSDADNVIEIAIVVFGAVSISGKVIAALFRDAVSAALATGQQANGATANDMMVQSWTHRMSAGGTDLITFRLRAGGHSAGTFTFNGANGSRLFGGVLVSSMTAKEYRKVYL